MCVCVCVHVHMTVHACVWLLTFLFFHLQIAAIKVVVANMACRVVDRAIQVYGGMGVCQDTPLPAMYAGARSLRIADGPDIVHTETVAKLELQQQLAAKLWANKEEIYFLKSKNIFFMKCVYVWIMVCWRTTLMSIIELQLQHQAAMVGCLYLTLLTQSKYDCRFLTSNLPLIPFTCTGLLYTHTHTHTHTHVFAEFICT